MKRIVVLSLIAALAATGAAGCSEREQSTAYKDGRYRGKPDTRPWDNTPPGDGAAGWKRGDHEAWENQLRARQGNQNENRRIGH